MAVAAREDGEEAAMAVVGTEDEAGAVAVAEEARGNTRVHIFGYRRLRCVL